MADDTRGQYRNAELGAVDAGASVEGHADKIICTIIYSRRNQPVVVATEMLQIGDDVFNEARVAFPEIEGHQILFIGVIAYRVHSGIDDVDGGVFIEFIAQPGGKNAQVCPGTHTGTVGGTLLNVVGVPCAQIGVAAVKAGTIGALIASGGKTVVGGIPVDMACHGVRIIDISAVRGPGADIIESGHIRIGEIGGAGPAPVVGHDGAVLFIVVIRIAVAPAMIIAAVSA